MANKISHKISRPPHYLGFFLKFAIFLGGFPYSDYKYKPSSTIKCISCSANGPSYCARKCSTNRPVSESQFVMIEQSLIDTIYQYSNSFYSQICNSGYFSTRFFVIIIQVALQPKSHDDDMSLLSGAHHNW